MVVLAAICTDARVGMYCECIQSKGLWSSWVHDCVRLSSILTSNFEMGLCSRGLVSSHISPVPRCTDLFAQSD